MDTEIKIQIIWAQAYAKRAVPITVFGTYGSVPTVRDNEAKNFMKLLTLEAAERLNSRLQQNHKRINRG